MRPTLKRTDFHPHDRFVAVAVRELARIERELRLPDDGAETQDHPIVGCLQNLMPWRTRPEPTDAPLKALWTLLHEPDFIDLLPFILEKFNTAAGYTELPNRGRLRNLDRQVFDTYYTPLDLARWLASQTTERACGAVRRLLATGGRENAEEALHQLLDIRICDLSCGAGILLREALGPIASAYRQIYDVLGQQDSARFASHAPFFSRGLVKLQALLTNVYGIDISPRAVESARTVLAVWAVDELHSAGVTAADVARWLGLNVRVGSGSHWKMGVEGVFSSLTAEMLRRTALAREEVRQGALHRSNIASDRSETEIVAMFPEVFVGSNPGFTCIVGNPPFGKLPEDVESSGRLGPPTCFDFGSPQESSVKWQYPKFVEGLFRLTRRTSYSAIVTPLNVAYSRELAGLRAEIEKAPRRSTFTFFDRSPDALFGDKVKTRNVVLLVEPSEHGETELWTTHLLRWTRTNRGHLWEKIRPTRLPATGITGFVPKLGTPLEFECWRTLRGTSRTLRSVVLDSNPQTSQDAAVHVYATAYNWLPAFRHVPVTAGSVVSPSMRTYHFRTAIEADVVYSCLVSSIAFWLWTVESDGFHLTDGFILDLPFLPDIFAAGDPQFLSELGRAHDLTVRSSPTVKSNAGLKVVNFNRQSAVHISHQIDEVIARAFALSPAFLELIRERVTNLVYVGREQTRATPSNGLEREKYAETR